MSARSSNHVKHHHKIHKGFTSIHVSILPPQILASTRPLPVQRLPVPCETRGRADGPIHVLPTAVDMLLAGRISPIAVCARQKWWFGVLERTCRWWYSDMLVTTDGMPSMMDEILGDIFSFKTERLSVIAACQVSSSSSSSTSPPTTSRESSSSLDCSLVHIIGYQI